MAYPHNENDLLWNCLMSQKMLQRVEKFQFRESDIVVVTFPRSGTTLTQELIWQMTHKENLDQEETASIDQRFPFLEYDCTTEGFPPPIAIDVLENIPESEAPRFIKTHLPMVMIRDALQRSKCKVIFVVRNPKDTCVSLFHFYSGLKVFGPWKGQWAEFVQTFMQGSVWGSWFAWTQHCVDFIKWKQEQDDASNILLLIYEDLVRNPQQQIDRLATFLDVELTDEQKKMLLRKCSFEVMYNNPILNLYDPDTGFRFIRQGRIGNWKEYFSEDENNAMDIALKETVDLKGVLQWTFE